MLSATVLAIVASQCSSPSPIPTTGLKLWLKADAGVRLDGATVGRWADESGNGNDAVQVDVEQRPLLVNRALNGRPVIRFDGADDALGLTGSERMSQISLFIVIKMDSGALHAETFYVPMMLGDNSDDGQAYGLGTVLRCMSRVPDTLNLYTSPMSGVRAVSPQCVAFGQWKIFSIITDHTMWNTAVRVNGMDASVMPSGSANMYLSFPLGNATGTGVGGIGGADDPQRGGFAAKCDVAEVIVYNIVLADSLRRSVERYLGAKYQIPLTAGGGK